MITLVNMSNRFFDMLTKVIVTNKLRQQVEMIFWYVDFLSAKILSSNKLQMKW